MKGQRIKKEELKEGMAGGERKEGGVESVCCMWLLVTVRGCKSGGG